MSRTGWRALARVEALLGERLDALTGAGVERLVAQRVPEDAQLDYKAALYRSDDKDKFELAKDVCAHANGAGGVIVCGIGEAAGVADRCLPLAVGDPELRRLRSTIASNTAPMPGVDPLTIPSSDGSGSYLVIVVPPSSFGPHAVVRGDLLGYPVRYGTQTRWLRESEIADRYRDRTRAAAAIVDRLEQVVDEGIKALGTRTAPWLIVGIAPTTSGHQRLSAAEVRRTHMWLRSQPATLLGRDLFDLDAAIVGFRRLSFTYGAAAEPGKSPAGSYVELATDGASFCAHELRQPEKRESDWIPGRVAAFSMDELVEWTAAALPLAATHAVRHAAASGDVLAVARLVSATEGEKYDRTMLVHYTGDFAMLRQHEQPRVEVTSTPFAPHTLDLDALDDGTELLTAVRIVASDVANALGWTEIPQINEDGQLALAAVQSLYRQTAQAWAAHVGAEAIEA